MSLVTVSLVILLSGFQSSINCDVISPLNGTINYSNDSVAVNRGNCNSERPVIGILSLPSWNEQLQAEDNSSSYIVASYVKFIESAGARVVPILVGGQPEYYQRMVDITNGILFTGGGLYLNISEYTRSAVHIWNHVNQINSQGDYYPVFGICLGFELIAYIANNLKWPLTPCKSWDKPMNVNFTINSDQLIKSTKLFTEADESIIQTLRDKNVTINYHHQCLKPETVQSSEQLRDTFRILSTNYDSEDLEFVSIMEGVNYPYYGLQFHPDRVIFEPNIVKSYRKTPHTREAVKVSQYFANFFINQARLNCHNYPETPEAHSQLIYNYCPTFTGLNGSHEQTYYFTW